MNRYVSVTADEPLKNDLQALMRLARDEDLRDAGDWTSRLTIAESLRGSADIVSRVSGVAAGIELIPWVVEIFDGDVEVEPHVGDGDRFERRANLATLRGRVRDVLTVERTVLNLVNRLCGIATQTAACVKQLDGTQAELYDTRKTTPGWRLIEKYAVRCGGGTNHRRGLYDGVLIKDNHVAFAAAASKNPVDLATLVSQAVAARGTVVDGHRVPDIVEVEVDGLEQFDRVLPLGADIILLDNFSIDDLRAAVTRRDAATSPVQLEASGNVRIDTIAMIAATGVDRISSGALTHQARSIDLGLDWTSGKIDDR